MVKENSKTETIKKRAIYVYLSSLDRAQRWKSLAEKGGTSISKFVIDHVENSLGQEEGGYKPRIEFIKRVKELEDEVSGLRKEKRMLEIVVDRLESELRHYRAQPFLEEAFQGVRRYEKDLVELLQRKGMVRSDEILGQLGIDPSDSALIKAVNRQLENLEGYGLVKVVPGGWKWSG